MRALEQSLGVIQADQAILSPARHWNALRRPSDRHHAQVCHALIDRHDGAVDEAWY